MNFKKIFYTLFFISVALSITAAISYYTSGYNVLEYLPGFWDWILSWGFAIVITLLFALVAVVSIVAVIKHRKKKK